MIESYPNVPTAGYCVGPILWGPLSEQYGRRPVFLVSFAVYTMFQVGNALARNTAQVLVFRFLGGTFAACPLTNSGAIVADVVRHPQQMFHRLLPHIPYFHARWMPRREGKPLQFSPLRRLLARPWVQSLVVCSSRSWDSPISLV